jgi:predicted nuclease of predicted toxin-antitoxin system
MISFLADENISPESADHLEALGYSCRSLRRDGPRGLTDAEIIVLAKGEERVILTQDLDFGEIYYLAGEGKIGILVLRLRYQTVEAVNATLERFLRSAALDEEVLRRSLVVVSEIWYRVYRGPRGEF